MTGFAKRRSHICFTSSSASRCVAAATQHDAEALVKQMCDRLLANPVIESYSYTVEPGNPPTA